MNKLQMAEQFRKAVQMFVASLGDEQAMEVASVFPAYQAGKTYKANDMFTYGVSGINKQRRCNTWKYLRTGFKCS